MNHVFFITVRPGTVRQESYTVRICSISVRQFGQTLWLCPFCPEQIFLAHVEQNRCPQGTKASHFLSDSRLTSSQHIGHSFSSLKLEFSSSSVRLACSNASIRDFVLAIDWSTLIDFNFNFGI